VIKTIEIEGFKSLEKVRLELGGLNLFIGANASGKSNFFDALRVLQGIGYGFTVDEIFNGKPKGAGSEVWEGIRGGTARAHFVRRGHSDSADHMRLALQLKSPDRDLAYVAEIRTTSFPYFRFESLRDGDQDFGETSSDPGYISSWLEKLKTSRDIKEAVAALACLNALANVQSARRLCERGENFAALVKSIFRQEALRAAYLSWLRQLTPMELDDVTILEGALGEPIFALKEGDETLPAPILSDGTLRFAAITAVFFQPDMPGIITIEEIENGIHPSRLRLLVELLKSQTRGAGPQVFATTHSPVVVAWLDEEDYKTTFLCRRDAESGASIITPLSEIPHLIDLVRKQPIGELFTEGWLEGAF